MLAFSGFSVCGRSSLSFLRIERCFCLATPLPRVDSGLFEHRSEVMEALEVVGQRHANLDGVIVGKALYERRVELADLLRLTA